MDSHRLREGARFLLRTGDPPPAEYLGAADRRGRSLAGWLVRLADRRDDARAAESVRALAGAGAGVARADSRGLSPLHLAVRLGLPLTARALVAAGADPRAVDALGREPIHFVGHALRAPSGRREQVAAELFALLVEHGANFHTRDRRGDLLSHLVGRSAPALTLNAIAAGCDPNGVARGRPREPVLVRAARRSPAGVIRALVRAGAELEPEYGGPSPLCAAVASRRAAAVRELLELGAAAVEAMYACICNWDKDIFALLRAFGAPVNSAPGSRSPLHSALAATHSRAKKEVVRALLAALAAAHSRVKKEVVRALLDAGADPTAEDSDGRTPLDLMAFIARQAKHSYWCEPPYRRCDTCDWTRSLTDMLETAARAFARAPAGRYTKPARAGGSRSGARA